MTNHRPELERTLQERLASWREVESQRRPNREIDLQVIAFSRQVGSGGRLIAARVSQILDLSFYDWDELRHIAALVPPGDSETEASPRDYEVGEGTLRHLDLPPAEYRQTLTRSMETIASTDGGVVLGRGANFVLPRERCLRVRIVAPTEIRADYLGRVLDLDPQKALLAVEEGDTGRRAFIRHFFDADIDESTHYDLVLNMDLYTLDAAVMMVLQAWGAARRIWGE